MKEFMEQEEQPIIVSIRCVTYNHERYIAQCLEGFVMQKTNFRFEAVVHDDASTDGTANIIREYARKYPDIIKPIYETENQYSKHNGSLRRIMEKACVGKYIAMCEGDDYWTDPLKIQKQVDYLEKNQTCSLVFTDYSFFYESTHEFRKSSVAKDIDFLKGNNLALYPSALCYGDLIKTATVMFRHDDFFSLPLSDKFLYQSGYFPMGDTPLWFGLGRLGSFHFMKEETTVYRKNSGSLTMQVSSRKKFFDIRSAELRMYLSQKVDFPPLFKQIVDKKYEDALCNSILFDIPIMKFHLNLSFKTRIKLLLFKLPFFKRYYKSKV